MIIPSENLAIDDIPTPDASSLEIIRFAQTLNAYQEVGGDAANLGVYVKRLAAQPLDALSLHDLRILLFARQRAHYHQGGGWPDGDPVMDEMRRLTAEVRSRLKNHA